MKACFLCLKCVVAILNSLIMFSGLAIGGFFVWLFLELSAMSRASQSALYITYFFIGLGAVMVLAGFLGCCGALQESRCILALFFLFIGVLLGSQLAVCVLSYKNFKSIEWEFGEGLKANLDLYHKNKGIKVSLDFAQRKSSYTINREVE
ncbi:CD9 antigen [Armadillidium vulgare]|nr:CD9 antigen [Armadillidium vulgare]